MSAVSLTFLQSIAFDFAHAWKWINTNIKESDNCNNLKQRVHSFIILQNWSCILKQKLLFQIFFEKSYASICIFFFTLFLYSLKSIVLHLQWCYICQDNKLMSAIFLLYSFFDDRFDRDKNIEYFVFFSNYQELSRQIYYQKRSS